VLFSSPAALGTVFVIPGQQGRMWAFPPGKWMGLVSQWAGPLNRWAVLAVAWWAAAVDDLF